MRIAVVVNGGVTETLQVTPLLRTLRTGAPQSRITLVCPAAATLVADGIPAVDELVPLRSLNGHHTPRALFPVWLALRRRRLDAVLVCSRKAALRWATYFSGVPERIGPAGGGVTSALLSGRAPVEAHENNAPTWLRLASRLGLTVQIFAPSFDPGPDARQEAERLLHRTGMTDGRVLVAIAPGAGVVEPDGGTQRTARWDPQRFALLANTLAQRHGAGIILLGAPSDRPLIEQTMLDLGIYVADLSSLQDVRVVAAILAHCDLLVAGDSPLLHVAAAVGTPAVGLFGSTDGRERGPFGGDHRIVQALRQDAAGDQGSAMEQIRVDDVLAGIEAAL